MSNFLNKVKEFFWTEEPEDEGDVIYDDFEEEKKPILRVVPKKNVEPKDEPTPVSNMLRIHGGIRSGVIDYRPRSIEDMASVARALRAGRAVVLHLDRIDFRLAQRALDFVSGVIYSCGCTSTMATDRIYIIVPNDSALKIRV